MQSLSVSAETSTDRFNLKLLRLSLQASVGGRRLFVAAGSGSCRSSTGMLGRQHADSRCLPSHRLRAAADTAAQKRRHWQVCFKLVPIISGSKAVPLPARHQFQSVKCIATPGHHTARPSKAHCSWHRRRADHAPAVKHAMSVMFGHVPGWH